MTKEKKKKKAKILIREKNKIWGEKERNATSGKSGKIRQNLVLQYKICIIFPNCTWSRRRGKYNYVKRAVGNLISGDNNYIPLMPGSPT